ncbi:hypothetical protein [Rhodococcus wratislaviensis]|uniref:hypothetical protein n=1 Tax=Rhodococcus wratislaviensis TaxID=44752 RepID=UPI0004B91E22|nr:hypothetical protein [Rhodococcus wratislaviensis]
MVDESDTESPGSAKTWAGWDNPALANADNDVVQIHGRMPDPLASVVVAASLPST